MEKRIKWGIIATGGIAHKFASQFSRVKNGEIIGVGSRTLSKAKKFAKEFNIPRYYGSYNELVSDEEIDAVYIATPHTLHYENTLLALNAGKSVLCEKPFAINRNEGEEMVSLANKKKKLVMEAMWARFNPALVKLRELLKQGIIGKVLFIRADFSFYLKFNPVHRIFNPELGGGALLDIGVYCIALAQMILGYPIEISGKALKGKTGVDEQNVITLSYKKGFANLTSSVRYDGDREALIVGEKGWIKLESAWHRSLRIIIKTSNIDIINFNENEYGLNYEINHFNELLRNGKLESPVMSLSDSLEILNIMDTLRKQWNIKYPNEKL